MSVCRVERNSPAKPMIRHFPRIKPNVTEIDPGLRKEYLKCLRKIVPRRPGKAELILRALTSGSRLPNEQAKVLITSNFHPNEASAVVLAERVAVGLQEKGYEVVLCKLPYQTSRFGLPLSSLGDEPQFQKWITLDKYQAEKLASVIATFPGFQHFGFHNTPANTLATLIFSHLCRLSDCFDLYAPLKYDQAANLFVGDELVEIGAAYGAYPPRIAKKYAALARQLFGEGNEDLILDSYYGSRVDIIASKLRGLMSARTVSSIVERMHALMTIRSAVA